MSVDFATFAAAFGYTPDAEGIAAMQAAYALPVTGELDEMTMRVLSMTRRCGVSDAPHQGGVVPKWGIKNLTWFIESIPVGLGLTKPDVRQCLRESLDAWSAVADLQFEEVNSLADSNLIYKTGRGKRVNFDGRGGTLAYAYFPRSGNYQGQSECWFDLDEPWTNNPQTNGILLSLTAMHENGHLIGLDHDTRNAGQLMGPTYNPRILKPQANDVARAVALYGKATQPVPTTPTPTVPDGAGIKAKIQLPGSGKVYQGILTEAPAALTDGGGW